jgi:hypothetical protein
MGTKCSGPAIVWCLPRLWPLARPPAPCLLARAQPRPALARRADGVAHAARDAAAAAGARDALAGGAAERGRGGGDGEQPGAGRGRGRGHAGAAAGQVGGGPTGGGGGLGARPVVPSPLVLCCLLGSLGEAWRKPGRLAGAGRSAGGGFRGQWLRVPLALALQVGGPGAPQVAGELPQPGGQRRPAPVRQRHLPAAHHWSRGGSRGWWVARPLAACASWRACFPACLRVVQGSAGVPRLGGGRER